MHLDDTTQKNVDAWLKGKYDEKSKDELKKMIQDAPNQVVDAFYTRMAFGTGGLRGIMGVGTNRMNQYTVQAATQGLANYINMQKGSKQHAVLIGHDCRHNSDFFTEITARVLAANNIKVYVYKELRPVPLVSFGCRVKQCTAAIMITASHNPPEYNGYKVYWDDGAQVLPPHDKGIIDEVYKIDDPNTVKILPDLNSPLIEWINDEIDSQYLETVKKLALYPEIDQKQGGELKVIYTPIHGAGVTMVPKILSDWGFSQTHIVPQQEKPDGSFPTVKRANPEEIEALQMGIDLLTSENADILLGTDPDCDRIGVVAMHQSKAALLTGNETASLCAEYITQTLKEKGKLPDNGALVKTIVTSELLKKIAESNGLRCFNVLTGFKYIGEIIRKWEGDHSYTYLFGGEESYGYLYGIHARDKDAVIMAAIIAEMSLQAKLKGKTLIDELHAIYSKYGIYREKLTSLVYPDSKETKDRIKSMIEALREKPPTSFQDLKVISIEDYENSTVTHVDTGEEKELTLPKSNVLLYWLEDGTKLVIRPSGTEPKVKIYVGVQDLKEKDIQKGIAAQDKRLEAFTEEMKKLLK